MEKYPSVDEPGRRHTKMAVRAGTRSHETASGFHDRPYVRYGFGFVHRLFLGWHPSHEVY